MTNSTVINSLLEAQRDFIHVTSSLPQTLIQAKESCQNLTLSLPQLTVKKTALVQVLESLEKYGVVLETELSQGKR